MEWVLLSLLASFSLAIVVLISKTKMYNHESVEFATSVRTYTALFTLPLALLLFTHPTTLSFETIFVVYIVSILNITAYWFVFKAVKHVDIHQIAPFLNLEAVFVALLAFLLFGEKLTTLNIIGIATIIISIAAIEYTTRIEVRKFIRNFSISKYFLIIIIAAAYYATFKIVARYLLHYKNINFIEFIVLLNVFNALNGLMLIFLTEKITPPRFISKHLVKDKITLALGGLTLLQVLGEYLAYTLAPNSAYVSSLRMLYVVFAILLSSIVLQEKYSKITYILVVCAFMGVVMVII